MPRHLRTALRAGTLALVAVLANAAGFAPGGVQQAAAAWTGSISVYVNDGDGAGRVTTDDGGIDCVFGDGRASGDCLESYVYADFVASATVVVHLTPATGSYVCMSQFGCQSSGATLSYNLSFNRATANDFVVAPEFWLKKYEVQVDIQGPGILSSGGTSFFCTPTGIYDYCHAWKHGQTATLIATPESGYPFTGWSGGPCEGSRELTCEFVITGPQQLTAQFGLVPLTIRRSTGGFICELGSDFCLQPGQSSLRIWRMVGSNQFIDAIPDPGYAFDHWNAGPCAGKATHCVFTLTAATELTATFRKLTTPAPSVKPTASARPTATTGAGSTPAPATPAPAATSGTIGGPLETESPATDVPGAESPGLAASLDPGASVPAGTGSPATPSRTGDAVPVDAPAGGATIDPLVLILLGLVTLMTLVIGFLVGRLRRGPRDSRKVAA